MVPDGFYSATGLRVLESWWIYWGFGISSVTGALRFVSHGLNCGCAVLCLCGLGMLA